jgi:hypothetical protein
MVLLFGSVEASLDEKREAQSVVDQLKALTSSDNSSVAFEKLSRLQHLCIMTLHALIRPFSGRKTHFKIFLDFLEGNGFDILFLSGFQDLIAAIMMSSRSPEAETFFRSWSWTVRAMQPQEQADRVLAFCNFVPFEFVLIADKFPPDATVKWLLRLKQLHLENPAEMELHITLGLLRDVYTSSLRLSEALSVANELLTLPPLLQPTKTDDDIVDVKFFTKIYEFFSLAHLLIAGNEPERDLEEFIKTKFVASLRDSKCIFGDYVSESATIFADFSVALLLPSVEQQVFVVDIAQRSLLYQLPVDSTTEWISMLQSRYEGSGILERCNRSFLSALEEEWLRLVDARSMATRSLEEDWWIKAVFMLRFDMKKVLCTDPVERYVAMSREAENFKLMFPASAVLTDFSRIAAIHLSEHYCRLDEIPRAEAEYKLICIANFSWIDWRLWHRCCSLSEEGEVLTTTWLEKYLLVRHHRGLSDVKPIPVLRLNWEVDFRSEYELPILLEVLTMLNLGIFKPDRATQIESTLENLHRRLWLDPHPWLPLKTPKDFSSLDLREYIDSWLKMDFPSEVKVSRVRLFQFSIAVDYLLQTGEESENREALKTMLRRILDHCDDKDWEVRDRVRRILTDVPFDCSEDPQPKKVIWSLPNIGQSAASTESVRTVRNYFADFFFKSDELTKRLDTEPRLFQEATSSFELLQRLGTQHPKAAQKIRQITLSRCMFLLRNPNLLFWQRLGRINRHTHANMEWMKLLYVLLALVCVDRSSDESHLRLDRQILSHLPCGPNFSDCLFFIARLYTFEGRFQHAIHFFERMLASYSANCFVLYTCHFGLYSLHLRMGDESTAQRHLVEYWAFSGPLIFCSDFAGPDAIKDPLRRLKRRIFNSTVLWPLGAERHDSDHRATDQSFKAISQLSARIIPFGLNYDRKGPFGS